MSALLSLEDCLSRPLHSFEVAADGKSIRFAPCGITSYHPKDVFHLGGTIDYVVFDGLYRMRNEGGSPDAITVVFVDVKWGSSRPSDVQRAVLGAMNSGRTRGETWTGREEDSSLRYQRRELR